MSRQSTKKLTETQYLELTRNFGILLGEASDVRNMEEFSLNCFDQESHP